MSKKEDGKPKVPRMLAPQNFRNLESMPKIDVPKFDVPKFQAPAIPKFEAPKFNTDSMPKFDAPKFEAPNIPKLSLPVPAGDSDDTPSFNSMPDI